MSHTPIPPSTPHYIYTTYPISYVSIQHYTLRHITDQLPPDVLCSQTRPEARGLEKLAR